MLSAHLVLPQTGDTHLIPYICKIVDIPLAIKRKNQKKIEPGDAYYIFEDEVSKVRIPLVSD